MGYGSARRQYIQIDYGRGAAHHPKAPLSYQPRWYSPLAADDLFYGPEPTPVQYMQMDSLVHFPSASSGWPPFRDQRYVYDASHRLVEMHDRENIRALLPDRRFEIARDAAGRITDVLVYEQAQSGGPYTLARSEHTRYNATGQAVSDSICMRDPSFSYPDRKYTYIYTASGMLAAVAHQYWLGSAWNDYERYLFSYNTSGLLSTMVFEEYAASAGSPRRQDSFCYAGSNPAYVYMLTSDYTSSGWQGRYRILSTLTAAGLWDQMDHTQLGLPVSLHAGGRVLPYVPGRGEGRRGGARRPGVHAVMHLRARLRACSRAIQPQLFLCL